MRFFLKKLLILSFLGKSTVIFLTIGFIASLCLGFIELMIALFIQVLLVSLGLIESGNIKFSGFEFSSVSIQNALVFLCVIGFCRFFFQMLSSQSASYASEKFGSRLRTIAIHDFLFSVTSKNQNASDIFFRFTEIIPKTGGMVSSVILLLSTLLQCISIFYIMLFSAWKEALLSLIAGSPFNSICSVCILNKKSLAKFGNEIRVFILFTICSPIVPLYNLFEMRSYKESV